MTRIGIVTKFPREHYSRKYVSGFRGLPFEIVILGSKKESTVMHEKQVEVIPAWTSWLYPVQCAICAIKRRLNVVHIQHEFNMFGFIQTIVLSPLLILLLSLIARKRCVITFHTVIDRETVTGRFVTDFLGKRSWFVQPWAIKILLCFIYYFCSLFAFKVIVHGRSQIQTLIRYGVSFDKILFVPHGVEQETIASEGVLNFPHYLNECNRKKVILFFGFIAPRKGIEYLIDAFCILKKKIDNVKLILAGGIRPEYNSYYKSLRVYIRNRNLEADVLFTNYVPKEHIPVLYKYAHVLVLPYVYPVGNSSPALYAIQFGAPLVATAIPPFIDMFKNNVDAVLVKPFDSLDLARGIESILFDAQLRDLLSKNILRKAYAYQWSNIVKDIVKKAYLASTQSASAGSGIT